MNLSEWKYSLDEKAPLKYDFDGNKYKIYIVGMNDSAWFDSRAYEYNDYIQTHKYYFWKKHTTSTGLFIISSHLTYTRFYEPIISAVFKHCEGVRI
jgi:hypothetical protein